jgi:FkbM family methyltransferase
MVNRNIRNAMHAVLRAARPSTSVTLLGSSYRVTYDARYAHDDRDFPLLAAAARGRRCVFDVGANKGIATLILASTLAKTGEIVAFEASEAACVLIRDHLGLNGLTDRVSVVNSVLAERSGEVIDFFWDTTSGVASMVEGFVGQRTRPLRKVTLSIDDYVRQSGKRPEMLKLDVEGGERQVIEGMRTTLRELRPTVVVELHSLPDRTLAENAATILPILDEVGYRMVYARTRSTVRDVAVLEGRGRCHALLLPEEEPLPAYLDGIDTSGL